EPLGLARGYSLTPRRQGDPSSGSLSSSDRTSVGGADLTFKTPKMLPGVEIWRLKGAAGGRRRRRPPAAQTRRRASPATEAIRGKCRLRSASRAGPAFSVEAEVL